MKWQRWITIGIILGILLLMFGLLMPAVYRARVDARKMTSKNNLKQIWLALSNYHDTHRCLPPGGVIREDGTAMNGWFMMLMPYLDSNPFSTWINYNKSWNSPDNLPVYEISTYIFRIPGEELSLTNSGYGLTNYLGNPNLFNRNSCVSLKQMKNGTTHTWMAGEVAGNYQPWGYPFNWRPLGTKLCTGPDAFGYPAWNGGHLLMADGRVSFFSQDTSPEIFKRFSEAPPVATEEQTARPSKVFQIGDFHWERVDLQADAKGKNKYLVEILRSSVGTPLAIYLYYAENRTSRYADTLHYLLQIDATTDIAKALESTTLSKAATPEQFQANVKTLQAIQKQLQ
ncbi:DUF1559 domain-containing protein [Gimesia aquarii]|uniref:DUF1559 domain-containing protein n=1 Tax=Gimesia aquarii TaxID=2527964 RepID=A0A517WUQ7_9PLAN|nr:DUF1559 domain-containing protein [Gimesia aquarii]QDU08986.1 hypothetical protein V202x_23560 [Gimesia aquarii]